MRAVGFALLCAVLAGCPETVGQQCPSTSAPVGQYQLTLVRPSPPPQSECTITQINDGGVIEAADASLVPDSGPTQIATICAGPEQDGGTLLTLIVPGKRTHTSDLLDGGLFDFKSHADPTPITVCGCNIGIDESFHGQLLLAGNAPFAFAADGGIPVVVGLDGGIVDTVSTPQGPCYCNPMPCTLQYNVSGTRL